MTHDEMIAVIQALKEGKVVQEKQPNIDWRDLPLNETIILRSPTFKYRVKPEPKKPREFWINGPDLTGSGGAREVFTYSPCHPEVCIHVREVLADEEAAQ